MKHRDEKGFTLVELLVVIAIVGILAVVAIPSLFKAINKAKVSELKTDISTLELAIKAFYIENDRLPCTQHKEEDMTSLFENIDSEYPYISPFGEEYYINCIHEEYDENKEVTRIDVGGFNIDNSIADMIREDEFFTRLNITLPVNPEGNPLKKPTLWIAINILK